MNWKGLVNLVLSSLGAGAMVFLTSAFAAGMPNKQSVTAAAAGALAATINHFRTSPMDFGK